MYVHVSCSPASTSVAARSTIMSPTTRFEAFGEQEWLKKQYQGQSPACPPVKLSDEMPLLD